MAAKKYKPKAIGYHMKNVTKPEIKTASEIITFPEMLHESGSIGFLEKMYIGNLLYMTKPKLIIETGLFKGYTHRFIADFITLNKISGCRIASFDLPDVVNQFENNNPNYVKNGISELIGGKLPDSLLRFLEQTPEAIDFAVIDSDHSYRGVLNDLNAIAPKLRAGGYIFCHDYRPFDKKYRGTSQAIDEFAINNGYDYLPLISETDTVWGAALLRKPEKYRTRTKRHLKKVKYLLKRFIR